MITFNKMIDQRSISTVSFINQYKLVREKPVAALMFEKSCRAHQRSNSSHVWQSDGCVHVSPVQRVDYQTGLIDTVS